MGGALKSSSSEFEGHESRASLHRIVRNSVFNSVVNAISAISYMVLFIALARGLQPTAMGEYYTLFALILVVQMVFEMGIPTVMTGRIARTPSRQKEILAEATVLATISIAAQIALFACMGLAASRFSSHPGALPRFLLGGCAAAAIQIQRYCAGVFRAFELFKYENVMRLGQGSSLAIAVLVLIKSGAAELNLMIAVLTASHVLAALYMIVNLWGRFRSPGWHWDRARMKDWLAESIPLGISESIRGQGWQLDTVLLGLMQPAVVVGIYNAAYRPLTMFYWLPLAATAATYPTFVRLATSPLQFNQAVANCIRMLWIGALPVAVVISLGAEQLITLLAGREYLEAAIPMRILVWKILFASLAILYRFVFAAIGQLPSLARIVLVAAVLDAAAELILIPRWGYLGACSGTLLGEFVFTAMTLVVCGQLKIRCMDWNLLARAALAASVMAALLWPVHRAPLPIFLSAAAVATGVYVLCCLLTGALGWAEARHLFDALGGRKGSTSSAHETVGVPLTAPPFEDLSEESAHR
ncbi:MAG TPA: flippase [Planctomycetaceae bacterium]|nr:flippase [Planctomycetaceae bacterium]